MKNLSIKYLTLGLSLIFIVAAALFYFQKEEKSPIKQALITKATPINYTGALPISVEDISTEATPSLTDMAAAVTAEALKAFSDSGDVALPLMSHWDVGETDAMNPTYMLSRLEQGEHVLVSWKLDPYYLNTIGNAYYEESIKKAAELNLPLVFILPSPESALTEDSYYKTLAQSENPNVIDMDGNIVNKLSPFGPDHLWNEIGEQWSSTSLMAQIQEWYPNPPLVVFINENRASKLSWSEVETSSRYVDNYPSGKDDEYKRTLVGAQWIEKYRQMHDGFKQGFIKEDWKNSVKFVSYNDFSDDLGQVSTWMMDATLTNQYLDICPFIVDGTTVNFDLTKSVDYTTIDAPQIPINNLPFMLQEAKRNNPSFMQQLSITHNSDMTDPALYRGLTQFGLWFLRPSVIRQDSSVNTLDEIEPLFNEMSDSVELIHNSDILSDFWKNGKLVSNGASDLNSNIPEQYIDDPRWFLLDVDANPERPWVDSNTINVWAFALVKGEAPNREWLLYIQSPEGDMSNISISISNDEDVLVNSTRDGSFYILRENDTPVEIISKAEEPGIQVVPTVLNNFSTSNYLEQVYIPPYDKDDSEHLLITTLNGEFKSENFDVNSPYKHIYIQAGNYGDVALIIRGSGTSTERKTFSLYNDNNIHPASLSEDEQANAIVYFSGASYWTVDRISILDKTNLNPAMRFTSESSHNIVNRHHIKNFKFGIKVYESCNYNTIQNSYIHEQVDVTTTGDAFDGIAINLFLIGDVNASIIGTKVLNNDIQNTGDAFQTTRTTQNGSNNCNGEGTIVDNNRMWLDNSVYRNIDGSLNPNGFYAQSEEGIDLKFGSENPENPMLITNNIIWSYRLALKVGTKSAQMPAFIAHFGVRNIKIDSNIAYDVGSGFILPSVENYELKNNITVNTNLINPHDIGYINAIYLSDAKKGVVINNTIINHATSGSGSGDAIQSHINSSDNSIKDNVIINAKDIVINGINNTITNTWLYEFSGNDAQQIEHVYSTIEESNLLDFNFNYERYTISPKEKILKDVIQTESSPHYTSAGSLLGVN